MKEIVAIVCAILLVCCCLTACKSWQDEDGTTHFMLFGERGPTKDGKPLSEEEISALNEEDSFSQRSSTEDDLGQSSDYPPLQKNDAIKGNILKKGWTSDENSILKGTNVSVTSETELFVITAKENKKVTFNFKAKLKSGDYEVVLIFPDKSETVLYDRHSDTKPETVTLKEGTNSIWLRCDSVIFKSIDLSIDGLESSDF